MSQPSITLVVDTKACPVAWPGCREVYTGAHYCDRVERHQGRHRCVCGATKERQRRRGDGRSADL